MPELGELLHATTRTQWRAWLKANHRKADEIWLVYRKKASGKPFVAYDDAVEEALCWGWIDGVLKSIPGTESRAQRWSPRKPNSYVSELNKARIRKMERAGNMTQAGRAALPDYAAIIEPPPLVVPGAIRAALEAAGCWDTFQDFPEDYRRIKVGWLDVQRGNRPGEFERRLAYLVEKTAKGEMYGTLP